MRVKCLAQEHNRMSPVRARTRTARSEVERTNHKATAPPTDVPVLVREFASPFGHPTQVFTQDQLASTCYYLPVRGFARA